jgi:Asp/Glu/hydantoin racemase
VAGLAEASFIQAAQIGPFAVVTGGERWKPMIQRLASNLGFGEHLRHIETVTPSGSELQANPEMAIQCLGEACRRAAKDGVRVIILGGAGLAGYAEKLQPICPLPLIDSACAGIEVLLNHQAPRAKNFLNGSYAKWSGMSGSLSQVNEFDLT